MLRFLDLSYICEISNEILKNKSVLSKATDEKKTLIDNFLLNYCAELPIFDIEKTFLLSYNDNGTERIVGLFIFEEKKISNEFPMSVVGEETNHNKMSAFIIDRKLLDRNYLAECFQKIFREIVNMNDKDSDEVIWYNYKNTLWAQRMDKIIKKENYYFRNIAEYFVGKILETYQFENKREKHLQELIKKAGL